jgi:hypothetical protein
VERAFTPAFLRAFVAQIMDSVGHAPSMTCELGYAEVLMPPESAHQSETHSEDGVDLTLIRWMLSLTPAERLDVLQRTVSSILSIRENQDEN